MTFYLRAYTPSVVYPIFVNVNGRTVIYNAAGTAFETVNHPDVLPQFGGDFPVTQSDGTVVDIEYAGGLTAAHLIGDTGGGIGGLVPSETGQGTRDQGQVVGSAS